MCIRDRQNQMMQEEMKAGETYQQLDRKISDLKKQLPFRAPLYFHFLEDQRAQKFSDPKAFTFQTTVDIDNPEEVEPAVKKDVYKRQTARTLPSTSARASFTMAGRRM